MKGWHLVKVTTSVDNDVWKRGLASSRRLSFYVEINSARGTFFDSP